MGLWDRLKAELIDIVEFLDDTRDTIVYRFDRPRNEIKYGAKLVVREGQAAVFVNEGKVADVFGPGTHTLETRNLPILATLKGWKYGFESPFKAEVYFVSTRQFTDLKWGTMNPVMLRDAEFGPVRVRAFGTYVARVKEPGAFVRQVVGTDGRLTTDEIVAQWRNVVVSRFADLLGESKIPLLDVAGKQDDLAALLLERVRPALEGMGVELSLLLVESVSLPPEVEQALDRRSSMGIVGDMNRYTQFQGAEAMRAAAANPGGPGEGLAAGMGLGMGMAMANQVAGAMQGRPGGGAGGGGGPPPLPGATMFFVAAGGQQTGPFPLAHVQQQIRTAQIDAGTLVWREGMANWAPAGQVPELAGAFMPAGGSPPPLPGA